MEFVSQKGGPIFTFAGSVLQRVLVCRPKSKIYKFVSSFALADASNFINLEGIRGIKVTAFLYLFRFEGIGREGQGSGEGGEGEISPERQTPGARPGTSTDAGTRSDAGRREVGLRGQGNPGEPRGT